MLVGLCIQMMLLHLGKIGRGNENVTESLMRGANRCLIGRNAYTEDEPYDSAASSKFSSTQVGERIPQSQFNSLEINAPNLKAFNFCGVFKTVSFKHNPLLLEISITLLSDEYVKLPEEETESERVKFFQCLPADIEDMELSSTFLEVMACMTSNGCRCLCSLMRNNHLGN
ncbi:hypothetical protein RHMOL_Rhmol09G0114400 [Rhododendron molle]|uniref:Uncharacterized protein n=1 Tax=Rhododendron molle TaxID=49168 RepID=A0ACC0ME44_RHOML|nr:hypothetical protein RHMOL_Rhmol09G0114400 [Rhododendron molle]